MVSGMRRVAGDGTSVLGRYVDDDTMAFEPADQPGHVLAITGGFCPEPAISPDEVVIDQGAGLRTTGWPCSGSPTARPHASSSRGLQPDQWDGKSSTSTLAFAASCDDLLDSGIWVGTRPASLPMYSPACAASPLSARTGGGSPTSFLPLKAPAGSTPIWALPGPTGPKHSISRRAGSVSPSGPTSGRPTRRSYAPLVTSRPSPAPLSQLDTVGVSGALPLPRELFTVDASIEVLGVPERMPFILGDDGSYDLRLNQFLRELPTMGVRAEKSWLAYARDLLTWIRFLAEQRSRTVWQAEQADVAAFHQARRLGPPETAVSSGTCDRGIATLDKFYRWAVAHGHVERLPFSYRAPRRRRSWPAGATPSRCTWPRSARAGGARPATSRSALPRPPRRRLARSPARRFGRSRLPGPQRPPHALFAELLVTTGMRLSEAASCSRSSSRPRGRRSRRSSSWHRWSARRTGAHRARPGEGLRSTAAMSTSNGRTPRWGTAQSPTASLRSSGRRPVLLGGGGGSALPGSPGQDDAGPPPGRGRGRRVGPAGSDGTVAGRGRRARLAPGLGGGLPTGQRPMPRTGPCDRRQPTHAAPHLRRPHALAAHPRADRLGRGGLARPRHRSLPRLLATRCSTSSGCSDTAASPRPISTWTAWPRRYGWSTTPSTAGPGRSAPRPAMSSPSPAGVSRGRRRVTFEADAEPVKSKVTSVGFVRHTLAFDEGKTLSLDYSGLPCPRLVRHLTAALASRAGVGGGHLTIGTGRMYSSAIRAFVPFIAGRYPARCDRSTPAISPPPTSTPSRRRSEVVCRATAAPLTSSWARWCGCCASWPRAVRSPCEPTCWPASTTWPTASRATPPPETPTARRRPRGSGTPAGPTSWPSSNGSPSPASSAGNGCEPVGRGWRVPENVMWHIDRHGPVRESELQKHQSRLKVGFRIADLNKLLYPTRADLGRSCCYWRWRAALSSRRARSCGPTASARPPAGGSRSTTASAGPGPISGGRCGSATPGVLARATGPHRAAPDQPSPAHSGSEWLWLSVHNPRVTRPTFTVGSSLFTSFVARHGLCADSGTLCAAARPVA